MDKNKKILAEENSETKLYLRMEPNIQENGKISVL